MLQEEDKSIPAAYPIHSLSILVGGILGHGLSQIYVELRRVERSYAEWTLNCVEYGTRNEIEKRQDIVIRYNT